MLSAAKAVEDKLDEEIAALDRLDPDDIEALRERRIQQMRHAAERRAKWRALGHGEYTEVPEKEFFSAAKASERLVCHFYRDNWPCKVLLLSHSHCCGMIGAVRCRSRGKLAFIRNGVYFAVRTLFYQDKILFILVLVSFPLARMRWTAEISVVSEIY